ncbi:hypothetical protein ILUMI_19633 [Ignelater luminosus]|uniref:Odorant receptor n=1 Tax=Ignelater luminosus TaxID=2038154 RepID=A0A8K0CML9_IGNLU|nr:hypothetical protein ILUMI_19633 [Ignelater luminosus]
METGNGDDVSSYMPAIMKRPFTVIRQLGLFSDNKFKRTSLAVFYGFFSFMIIAITMMQFKSIKGDIYQLAANIESMVAFTQLFAKTVIAAYQQEAYKKLIQTTKHFWNFDKCDRSAKVEMMSIMSLSFKAQKVFVRAVFICAIFAILFSLFGRAPLPIGIWTLEGYDGLRRAALIIQALLVIYSAHLIGEDRMVELENALTDVNLDILGLCDIRREEEQMVDRLSKAIFYHIDAANGQAGCTHCNLSVEIDRVSCLTIIQVYAPTNNSTEGEIEDFDKALEYTLQKANVKNQQALAVADAVYFSNWYSQYFPSLKIPVCFMIQNAQREVTIKASGLVIMDATTVLNILPNNHDSAPCHKAKSMTGFEFQNIHKFALAWQFALSKNVWELLKRKLAKDNSSHKRILLNLSKGCGSI